MILNFNSCKKNNIQILIKKVVFNFVCHIVLIISFKIHKSLFWTLNTKNISVIKIQFALAIGYIPLINCFIKYLSCVNLFGLQTLGQTLSQYQISNTAAELQDIYIIIILSLDKRAVIYKTIYWEFSK